MENEIWKLVGSKPGLMASSLGRVRLPESISKMPYGGCRKYETKPTFGNRVRSNSKTTHYRMCLTTKKYGNIKIHKMVCEAFHGPKPFAEAIVLHEDENALNNRSDNLRWSTQKANLNSPKFIAYCKSRTGENNPLIKGMKKNFIFNR